MNDSIIRKHWGIMDTEQFKKMLTSLLESGELKIITHIQPERAEHGGGQWNAIYTSVMIDNNMVHQQRGDIDLCDPV